jgi:hypothetical protein
MLPGLPPIGDSWLSRACIEGKNWPETKQLGQKKEEREHWKVDSVSGYGPASSFFILVSICSRNCWLSRVSFLSEGESEIFVPSIILSRALIRIASGAITKQFGCNCVGWKDFGKHFA